MVKQIAQSLQWSCSAEASMLDDPELLCNSEASGSVLSCLRRIWHCIKNLLQLISYQKLYLMEGYLVQGIFNTFKYIKINF